MSSKSKKSILALTLTGLLCTSAAHAIPFEITSQLTGDSRKENPDDIGVQVTINGDTDSNVARWFIDLNSSQHPDMKLHEFYFSMSGNATDYSFSNFTPVSWTIQANDVVKGAGAGGATFTFELIDPPPGHPKVTVANSISISFEMTKSSNFAPIDFINALTTNTAAGAGQIGAHLQGLNIIGTIGASGFAIGSYEQQSVITPNSVHSVPEPGVLMLMGSGLVGVASMRRRSNLG